MSKKSKRKPKQELVPAPCNPPSFNKSHAAGLVTQQLRSGEFRRNTKMRVLKAAAKASPSSEVVELVTEEEFIERKLLEKKGA